MLVPGYVCDAMKEKKRFDRMRVRAALPPSSFLSRSRTCRADNKKTRKNSSGSTREELLSFLSSLTSSSPSAKPHSSTAVVER
jgi:hypothetical protein